MMKAALALLIVLFSSGIAFAESRGILIEFMARSGNAPTVNVYSDVESEQRTGASIAEAAAVLSKAENWGSTVSVYLLSETHIETNDLLTVLGGMRSNAFLALCMVELGSRSEASKQLLTKFKSVPTKTPSP